MNCQYSKRITIEQSTYHPEHVDINLYYNDDSALYSATMTQVDLRQHDMFEDHNGSDCAICFALDSLESDQRLDIIRGIQGYQRDWQTYLVNTVELVSEWLLSELATIVAGEYLDTWQPLVVHTDTHNDPYILSIA